MFTDQAPFCPVTWLIVELDHPALAGHFPGRPIVPGVVLLDHALTLLEAMGISQSLPIGLPVVKFLQPVLPGEQVLIGLVPATGGARFICRSSAGTVAQGTFTFSLS